ncbi:AraC family transcriptional regulator [Cohnella silvisoli]|uniref:Helix-turn-helix transcriptional regulator n=1 Tax=Cohnella silvisoli TaxID=2873699 RepID=A0ABV1KTB0_9BACL|nr:helix-turn-helix transcriptional regulator [Cohnella silvisoli]MCD9021463.1 AraC family transcriptional regulator [Cohnella silvisoli]
MAIQAHKKFEPLYSSYPNFRNETYLYGAHTAEVGQGWTCSRHLHHMMFEINLVLEGCQTCFINDEKIEQQPGDLIIIPPMVLHEFKQAHPYNLRYFVFHVQISDSALLQLITRSQTNYYPSAHPLNVQLRPLIDKLMAALASNASKTAVFSDLFGVLTALEQHYSAQSSLSLSHTADALSYRIAREIESLVLSSDESERPPLSNWLEALSYRIGISRRHCARVFQQTYQLSPRDYLAILRRQEAMHALLNCNDSLEHIAHRIGFENVQSFIRQFTKWTGMTPGVFRRNHRNDFIYLTPLEEK